jgi:hypothetical protein
LHKIFAEPLSPAFVMRHQRQNRRGRKVPSLRAPEVERIGMGKPIASSMKNPGSPDF